MSCQRVTWIVRKDQILEVQVVPRMPFPIDDFIIHIAGEGAVFKVNLPRAWVNKRGGGIGWPG